MPVDPDRLPVALAGCWESKISDGDTSESDHHPPSADGMGPSGAEKGTAMSTRVTIAGNLTADPREVQTQNGALVSFTVAETSRRQVDGVWTDRATTFYDVRTFNGLGSNVAASLTKGQHVIVVGDLEAKVSEKDGVKYTNLSVFGREVGVSLRFGTADFTKGAKASSVDSIVDE